MNKFLAVLGAVALGAILVVGCTSDRPRGPGGSGGPPGLGGPGGPSDAAMALMTLQGLVQPSDATLKLTSDQIAVVLPVLKAWKTNVAQVPDTDTKGFVQAINDTLTNAQKAYRPGPPLGKGGQGGGESPAGPGGPGGQGDRGGPGGPPDTAFLLDQLIQELS